MQQQPTILQTWLPPSMYQSVCLSSYGRQNGEDCIWMGIEELPNRANWRTWFSDQCMRSWGFHHMKLTQQALRRHHSCFLMQRSIFPGSRIQVVVKVGVMRRRDTERCASPQRLNTKTGVTAVASLKVCGNVQNSCRQTEFFWLLPERHKGRQASKHPRGDR